MITAKYCRGVATENRKKILESTNKELEESMSAVLTRLTELAANGYNSYEFDVYTFMGRGQHFGRKYYIKWYKRALRKRGFKCSWFGDSYYDFRVKW